jgi:hypothetical protein
MATLSSQSAQQLLQDTRIFLNSPDPLNSFWGDNELLGYLNDGIRKYFVWASEQLEGYFTTTSDINIVANTATIALPSDFFMVKRVLRSVSNGYIALPYNNTATMGYSTLGGNATDTYLPSYSFQGTNLLLNPVPNSSQTAGIRLEYIQFPDNMIWGGDLMTSHISPVFKELVKLYAVHKAKLKESLVTGGQMYVPVKGELMELEKIFKDSLAKRSAYPTATEAFNPEL